MSVLYEIGPFRLDVDAKVLTRAGITTRLGARAVAVLVALVERPNEYVPKAHLIEAAWPGLIVEEANLNVQVSAIRRSLAEAPGGERWIETLARRGYRFAGPVSRLPNLRARATSRAHTNLPEALTSFIGRERELVEIKRLLPGIRLLTITGTGGIGKTRLAQQVAAEVADAFRDGAWFVDLAPLNDPAQVDSAAAQVLGVGGAPGRPLRDALVECLRDREVLLVLDNCEHLLDATAQLVGYILHRAAETTIVATSREALQVDGEQAFPLSPLTLPDPGSSADAIAASEAAQLFMDRARRQQPHFALTPAQAPTLAELCNHLDGIPLALELAAARVPSLTIAQINDRLNDRFRLLTGGARTSLRRNQTLRGTLDWSHGLLSEAECVAWRRLAVFPGAFTLEAAACVASGGAIDGSMVVDLLARLVSRSLVVAVIHDAGARYRLLETTRAYGLERLDEAGETESLKLRHAHFVHQYFERAHHDWWRMSQAEWVSTYATERDNVRAALDWAFDQGGDSTLGIALAGRSAAIWWSLSLVGEGTQRLEHATRTIGPAMPESDQALLWLGLGNGLRDAAPTDAATAFERAIMLYRRAGDTFGTAEAQLRLALALAKMCRCDDATRAVSESIDVVAHSGLPRMKGVYCVTLGMIETMSGNLITARDHYEDAMSYYRIAKFDEGARAIAGELANLRWALGDLEAAEAAFVEYVTMLQASSAARHEFLGFALCNLAGLLTERGELDRALAAAREGLPLLGAGKAWIFADHVALRAALAGRATDAAHLAGYADAMRACKQAPREPNEARARERLQTLLTNRFGAVERERLLADGAQLGDDDACRLALDT